MTDMSERERMNECGRWLRIRNASMVDARRHQKYEWLYGSKVTRSLIQSRVIEAREANRQAVRLWYGRTTRP